MNCEKILASCYARRLGCQQTRHSGFSGLNYGDFQRSHTRFVETPPPPQGATVVDHSWLFVNKSGGPDMRFKENRQLPVCKYAALSHAERSIELCASNERIVELLPRQ